jgi:hypothetical protein
VGFGGWLFGTVRKGWLIFIVVYNDFVVYGGGVLLLRYGFVVVFIIDSTG